MNAIELKELTKRFGSFTAVDRVTFNVAKGSIFGFLGPNGSGKSTCIRMLCGLLEPTSGSATVNGYDIVTQSEAVKRSIGYMSQAFSLYKDLSVNENLTFFGGIYGLKGQHLKDRMQEVIDLVGIEPYRARPAGQLSGGWKQRLALATALIHEPAVVFLDEPTAGIDPVARRDLWDLLFDLAGAGKTLFVTTHYMDEAERCGRVGYIYLSNLVALGTVRELQQLPAANPVGTTRVQITTSNASSVLDAVRKLNGVREATIFGSSIHALIETASIESLKAALPGATVAAIIPSLEDVFVTLTYKIMGGQR